MGYSIAWERRWALLAVLVPVLVPASLILLALRLLSGQDDAAVINGELVIPVPDGFVGFVYTLVAALGWLLAVSAGVAALGLPSLGTKETVLKAARSLPLLALWGFAAVAVTLLAFALGEFAVFLLAILALALFARVALILPEKVLDGESGLDLFESKALRITARIGVGTIGVPLLLAWCYTKAIVPLPEYFPSAISGAFAHLAGMLLLVVIVAGQAGTLTVIYLELQDEDVPPPGPAQRWWVVAALVLPTLATVALTPPTGPLITVRRNVFSSEVEDIVWNPGQRPVVFTSTGAYLCSDNACSGGTHLSGPDYLAGTAVGVTADGVPLMVSQRHPTGQLILTRCAPECAEFGRVSLPDQVVKESVPRYGIAGAPDGSVWLAVAQQRTNADRLELSLLNCGKARCDDDPKRIIAGSVDGTLDEERPGTVHLRFDAQGRPIASFDYGFGSSYVVSCDSVACAKPSITQRADPTRLPRPPGGLPDAAAVNDLGLFYLSTEQGADSAFLRLTIGRPAPRFERIVLWHCPDPSCERVRRIPLHTREVSQAAPMRIAVGPDRTVLITEGTTLVSLRL